MMEGEGTKTEKTLSICTQGVATESCSGIDLELTHVILPVISDHNVILSDGKYLSGETDDSVSATEFSKDAQLTSPDLNSTAYSFDVINMDSIITQQDTADIPALVIDHTFIIDAIDRGTLPESTPNSVVKDKETQGTIRDVILVTPDVVPNASLRNTQVLEINADIKSPKTNKNVSSFQTNDSEIISKKTVVKYNTEKHLEEIKISNKSEPFNSEPSVTESTNELKDVKVQIQEPFTQFINYSQLYTDCHDVGFEKTPQSNCENVFEQQLNLLLQLDARKQLKRFLRSATWALNCSVRKDAWRLLCAHFHRLEKSEVYLEMEKEMFGDLDDEEDIPLPVWVQSPLHHHDQLLSASPHHYLTQKGIHVGHRIMVVISQLYPDITYSPAVLPLVYLFLHYLDGPDCFSCVSTLLISKKPVYLTQTKVAFEASKLVLRDLTRHHAKSTYIKLARSGTNIDAVFDNWLWWIYQDLPFSYVVLVTDSYIMEGIKVLYRVVLAILILYTKYSGQQQDIHGVCNSISFFCQKIPVSPRKLLKVAFGIRGFSRQRIWKLQTKHELYVNRVAAQRQASVPKVASSLSVGDASRALARTIGVTLGFHNTGSHILSADMLATVWNWLPSRHTILQPLLLYTSAEHGTSLRTLYSHVEMYPVTIFIIQTTSNEIFGAFCSGTWYERKSTTSHISYFGTGETFLFTLCPERCKYEWVGMNNPDVPLTANMFMAGDNSCLFIGGGNGVAIALDETMEHCRTERCDTFNNPPLSPDLDFTCKIIEVFGLQ